ncbi:YkuS family protein [Clostridium sp. D2Q-11]|uniref:YkuS family protein n=1 Tax=Anaeromonas frigoriresistens TaxID=2683708 RepID=A0A942Z9M0_9FIRM|nr:YkuS family protein [Anaeromonas frigoriresistens]MBS4539289.1 YkuS family protein [Anaeromonas frigoriresistens]
MKNVSVQNGLNELAQELSRRGYNIVDSEDSNSAEVYIYMADGYNVSSLTNMMDMDNGEPIENPKGTLLINATGKNIEQIEEIINKGYYTPLF